jgi:uncharacterized iron-regulated membrane protein
MVEKKRIKKSMRTIHIWVSLIVILPLIVVSTTGLILMLKKQLDWVQPLSRIGATQTFTLSPNEILNACKLEPLTGITEWAHIDRLDIRPNKGIIKVQGPNSIEVQLDATTGSILHIQKRNSDFIENLHDGSYFGDTLKWSLFFIAEVLFVLQLITGIYLFVAFLKKKKRK